MSTNYQDYIAFKRKIAEIERQLNNSGYQTEDDEREGWLSTTRYKKQSQMAYFFIMQESIDRVVIEIKSYLELHNSVCVTQYTPASHTPASKTTPCKQISSVIALSYVSRLK